MNKLWWFCLLLACVSGCQKEDIAPTSPEELPRRVQDIIPPAILDSMLSLGMPIYPGDDPPLIEGNYEVTRFVLKSSNRPNDRPGQSFRDYMVTFEGQDNERHEIKVDYINGQESASDIGSVISGSGCQFSVYINFDSVRINGASAKFVHVLSGTMTDTGIQGFHYANFMVDDRGDPTGVFIENGQGRVIIDQDGDSPRQGAEQPIWYERLPDCPCELTDDIAGRKERCGTWNLCGDASQEFHYGATYEIRWLPDEAGAPGQQCTYDENKQLITAGLAAGSPDRTSPGLCGYKLSDPLNIPNPISVCGHVAEDVIPWGDLSIKSQVCLNSSARPVPCEEYLRDWPANRGDGCQENVINGIDHIRRMVRRIDCQDVTTFLQTVAASTVIGDSTKLFISGQLPKAEVPEDLKDQLIKGINALDCPPFADGDSSCGVFQRVINNL